MRRWWKKPVVAEKSPKPVPEPERLPEGVAFRVRKSTDEDPDGEVRSWHTDRFGVRTEGPKVWWAWARSIDVVDYWNGRPSIPTSAYASARTQELRPAYVVALLGSDSEELATDYIASIFEPDLIEHVAARLWKSLESTREWRAKEAAILGDYPPKTLGGAS